MHQSWFSPLHGFVSSVRTPPPVLAEEVLFRDWEATGEFWRPEEPEKRLWGRLVFSGRSETVLELEGSFWDWPVGGEPCEVLRGELYNGAPCTLLDSFCSVETFGLGDDRRHRTICHSRLVVHGAEFDSWSEARLQSLHVQFSHLDEWFAPGFMASSSLEEPRVESEPDSFCESACHEGRAFDLRLSCVRWYASPRPVEGKLEWRYRYELIVEPEEDAPLSWFLEVCSILRGLFSFLVGTGIATLRLHRYPPNTEEVPVELLASVQVPLVLRTRVQDFSCRYKDVAEQFPVLLQQWFSRREQLAVVCGTYDELQRIDGIDRHSVFLRVVQTLEHFHGVVWPDDRRYLRKEEWRRVVRALRPRVAESFTEALGEEGDEALAGIVAGRVGNLNALSLRSRLEKLFREIPLGELYPLLGNPHPDHEEALAELLKGVEATRHYLAHYSDEQRAKALDGEALEKATGQLWAVLTFWLAQSVGLDESASGSLALNARRAMFLVAAKNSL